MQSNLNSIKAEIELCANLANQKKLLAQRIQDPFPQKKGFFYWLSNVSFTALLVSNLLEQILNLPFSSLHYWSFACTVRGCKSMSRGVKSWQGGCQLPRSVATNCASEPQSRYPGFQNEAYNYNQTECISMLLKLLAVPKFSSNDWWW